MTTDDKYRAHFTQLVLIFHTAAMQHMGKLKNPLTDTIERSLVHAQSAIDMLDMLKNRMKGNLSNEEERFLSTVLQELKLNYLDEINKPGQDPAEGQSNPSVEPPAASPSTTLGTSPVEPPAASPSTTLGTSPVEPPVASPSTTLGTSPVEPPVASPVEPSTETPHEDIK